MMLGTPKRYFFLTKKIFLSDFITLEDFQKNENQSEVKSSFILSVSCFPASGFSENQFTFTINYKSSTLTIQELELVEPFEICDSIKANKLGILYRGFIYPPEFCFASLSFNLFNLVEKLPENSSALTKTMERINQRYKSTTINASKEKEKTTGDSIKHKVAVDEQVKLRCEIKLGKIVVFSERKSSFLMSFTIPFI